MVTINSSCYASIMKKIYLPMIKIPFKSKRGTVKLNALIDSGSEKSYISSACLQKIDKRLMSTCDMTISGLGGENMSGEFKSFECVMKKSKKEAINAMFVSIDTLAEANQCEFSEDVHLKNGEKFRYESGPIEAIVGNDNYFRVVTGEMLSKKLAAIKTVAGWTLQGSVGD